MVKANKPRKRGNMKKSLLTLLLASAFAALLALSLSGCGHQHTWQDATCDTPKTCSECGETEGDALGHEVSIGKCSRCGTYVAQDDWEQALSKLNSARTDFSNTLTYINDMLKISGLTQADRARYVDQYAQSMNQYEPGYLRQALSICEKHPELTGAASAITEAISLVPAGIDSYDQAGLQQFSDEINAYHDALNNVLTELVAFDPAKD